MSKIKKGYVHEGLNTRVEMIDRIRKCYIKWDKYTLAELYHEYASISGEYIRQFNPVFVTQRTLSNKRPDLGRFLKEIHLRSNDLFEVLCRTYGICGNNDLYVTRFPETVIDVHDIDLEYDIPDFDTDCYGWVKNGVIQDYGLLTSKTMNCKSRI